MKIIISLIVILYEWLDATLAGRREGGARLTEEEIWFYDTKFS